MNDVCFKGNKAVAIDPNSFIDSGFVSSSGMEELLSLGEVKRLWDEHQSRLHNHDRKLWNLLMLAAWSRRHGRREEGCLAAAVEGA